MLEQILHYRLIRKLGSGGMGEVFLAQDTRLERQVALKLLSAELARDEEHRRRFLREARAASALSHPSVCVIHEVGESEDGRPFIAMEFVAGRTLAERIAGGPLSILDLVVIAEQVADALDAAHSRGLIHRDIKPANITVDKRSQVKVLDFGLAKWISDAGKLSESGTASVNTEPGVVLGTPAYMSPEQAMGQPLDARSDIFSLGVVIYELVTGRPPFSGSTFAEVSSKILQGRYDAMARFNYDIPPELERITRKCLARQPENRFQSAHELCVDLRSLKRTLEASEDAGGQALSSPTTSAWALTGAKENVCAETAFVPQSGAAVAIPVTAPPAASDVLLSYANLDDQPLVAGRHGWISQFQRNLELRVGQLSGKEVRVWKQPEPAVEEGAASTGYEHVCSAKTFVSIVSPPFVRSTGCRRLVEEFWRGAERSGRLEINNHSRILKVVKTPVEADDIPPEIRPLLARLVPYEFFERDTQSGRVREFDEAFGELARQRFHERVYDVAFEVSQVLKYFDTVSLLPRPLGAAAKRVFLAATTSDLEPQRDQLRRELLEQGHEVLPKQPMPLVASEIAAVVQSCLERCDLAIHLVGEIYGFVPEATELSIVRLQNQVAAQSSAQSGLARLIWMPRAISPQDPRQAAFLREIERDPATHQGAEVVIDSLENLKVLLRTRWSRPQATPGERPAEDRSSAPPRVYIICDREDETAVEPIGDFFYEHGIEVSLPGFDAAESEVQRIHIQNLRDCDAALVYYGAGGMNWVDFNVRDLQKAAGYRESRPIRIQAVYIAPPSNRRKERFRSVTAQVIHETGELLNPATLESFVKAVKAEQGNRT